MIHDGGDLNVKYLVSLLLNFDIQLVQCLDVVRGESDWNEANILVSSLGQTFHRVGCLRSLPRLGSDLRLPR
jgi:hypothetical protein